MYEYQPMIRPYMKPLVRKVLVPVLLLVVHSAPALVYAQDADTLAQHYARWIALDELKQDLEVLASDAYEGRDTGKEGQRMAARYIKERFQAYGVPPVPVNDPAVIVDGYYQPFELIEEKAGSVSIVSRGQRLEFLKEIFYFSEDLERDVKVSSVRFYGDGSALANAKRLKGQVVLTSESGSGNILMMLGTLRGRAEAASRAGATVLLVATPRMELLVERFGHYLAGGRMRLAIDGETERGGGGMQTILVDQRAMERMLGGIDLAKLASAKPGRKVPVDMQVQRAPQVHRLVSENVLAYIEGSDKKDELVVITAHYDHIGVENGEVYNGADDDGSGTVAIMAIAKAFAQAKANGHGPRRSVLVMPVSGEEKGLLGSRYYSERPVFPLENTVANINIDMIGRVDSIHATSAPYLYVIGSDRLSSELHAINEEANARYTKLDLDYRFNDRKDPNRFYYRSDHYNFARKGVPAVFYFSGVHEDYHGPGDTVDKIRFDLLHQRALLAFHTAWILANRAERIVVDGQVE